MKIRGTPAHIAEKYVSLARDAQSTGDPVLAENYLQHAEHYSRIIMAYREQLNQPGEMNGGAHRMRVPGDAGEGLEEFGDDQGPDTVPDDGLPQSAMPQGPGHQQGHQQPRHQGGEHGRPDRQERPFRRDQNRPRYADRGERHGFAERERQPEVRSEPQERAPEREADAGGEQQPRRRDRFQQPHEQPEFLRRPVRRARSSENGESGKGEPSGD